MMVAAVDSRCPDEEDIAAFVRGCLESSRVRALEAHVAACAACRRLLSVLAQNASQATADSVSPTIAANTGAGDVELPIGARVGRYVVLEWRGAGSMGVVYSARDPELNRSVALKVLRNDGASPADRVPIRDLLLREAQAMAQLAHPNVVTVFDVGSVDDRVFIAMELIDGLTLAQWLRAARRAPGEIIRVFLAAGSGLAAAHAAGLVHRDFKPDNVLLGSDGRVCVTDFGLARHAAGEPVDAPRVGEPDGSQTGLAGTLAYMAPEQYLGRRADMRADQFSFAVALYEALYREKPFAPHRFADVAHSCRVRPAPRGNNVPLALRHVLLRALSPVPDERYPSMASLLAALAPGPRLARMRGLVAIATVAIAIAAAGGYAIHLRDTAHQRAELVGRLRGLAPELRTRLRSAHMLPLHDIRAAREGVRSAMREVERQLQAGVGQDEIALGSYVLGEGWRALGDHERALAALEDAWTAGERGPHMDAALGHALGAAYESRLTRLEQMAQSHRREAEALALARRYRDPAMAHLRAALAARHGSPAYFEAQIAFHQRRYTEASQRAGAAFAESPTFYEAGALEAKARHERGRQLLNQTSREEARAEFAEARRIYQRVLEIARSDDEAWLGYGDMVYAQAIALNRGGAMPAELQGEAIAAFHTVQRINSDNANGYVREAEVHLAQGNIEVLWFRDPSSYVDKGLALANQARAHGADVAEVKHKVCLAHWQRAVHQGSRGGDPHASFDQAIIACANAVAARPDAEKYDSLGVVYGTLGRHDAEHGIDPMHSFELSDRSLRSAIAIDDDPGRHYNLARLWTCVARYQVDHGRDPQRAIDRALAEYDVVRRTTSRADAWAGTSDALAVRAQFQRQQHEDARATLAEARAANERALALDDNYVQGIRYRVMIAALEAEELLAHGADPGATIQQIRADVDRLLGRFPDDRFAHRFACRAELFAARWALAHRGAVEPLLARAANAAAAARQADATDPLAWTASAEVELVRGEVACARGEAGEAIVARGLAFVARAMVIDPRLAETLKVRDALERQAPAHRRSTAPRY